MKVTQTKIHKTLYAGSTHEHNGWKAYDKEVPVAEGKLVLVDSTVEWANKTDSPKMPIILSLTEKIEVGDWGYGMDGLFEYKGPVNIDNGVLPNKVLALPEHFSPKHLQDIVDGELKDNDKVLIECWNHEMMTNEIGHCDVEIEMFIKLNPHITLHKIEDRMVRIRRRQGMV